MPGTVALSGRWTLSVRTRSAADSIAAGQLIEEAARRGWSWRMTRPQPRAGEVVWQEAASLPPEGYRLILQPGRILVAAATPAGRFHAVQTLRQILRISEGGRVPAGRIDDAPALAMRAVSMDISRGQVPTTDCLKRTLRTLSYYKLNTLFLYIEDSFAFASAPAARAADQLEDRDVRELQRVADSCQVALIPIVQSLAHHERLLAVPEYNRFAENPRPPGKPGNTASPDSSWHRVLWNFATSLLGLGTADSGRNDGGPSSSTLCPTDPASVAFAEGLVDDVTRSFRSDRVHVGGDEATEVGTGRSEEAVRKLGRSAVVGGYFTNLHDRLRRGGRRMMVYSDMIDVATPGSEWPRDADLVVWDYSPEADFARADSLKRRGFESIVLSSGIWDWKAFYPDAGRGFASIAAAAAAAKRMRMNGTVTSSWGDGGGENLPQNSWASFAYSAASAWETRPVEPVEFLERFARTHLGHAAAALAEVERLVGWQGIDLLAWNSRAFHRRPLIRSRSASWLGRMNRLQADMLTARRILRENAGRVSVNTDHVEALSHAVDRYAYLAMREISLHEVSGEAAMNRTSGCCRGEAGAPIEAALGRMIRQHESLTTEYRRLWLRECRPAGLTPLARRMDEQRADLQGFLGRLRSGQLRPWRPGGSNPVESDESDDL